MTMASLRLLGPRLLPLRIDWRRNVRPILLVAVPALVILAALTFWLQGGRYASTENAYVKADIAQIASEVQGRIVELRDPRSCLGRGRRRARAPRSGALPAGARQGRRPSSIRRALMVEQLKVSLRETKAEHKEAESRMLYLEVQAKRQHDLAARGVSPAAKLELADSDALQARDRAGMLRERIARVEAALGGDPELPTDSYPAGAREDGLARSRRARSRLHRDQGAARRHRGQFQAAAGRADQGADAAVLHRQRPPPVGAFFAMPSDWFAVGLAGTPGGSDWTIVCHQKTAITMQSGLNARLGSADADPQITGVPDGTVRLRPSRGRRHPR